MTFAPSETSRIVMVPIIDDSIGVEVEQFTAQLSVPPGQSGVVLGEDIATVEITDDDRKLYRYHGFFHSFCYVGVVSKIHMV